MNIKSIWRPLLVIGAMSLQGCIAHWTEEVRLGDGSIITVSRTEGYATSGGIGEACWFCDYRWGRMSIPVGGKTVVWKSSGPADVPIILDIVNGTPIVISASDIETCSRKKNSQTELAFYGVSIYRGSWAYETEVPDYVLKIANLHPYKPTRRDRIGTTVAEKDKWISSKMPFRDDGEDRFIYVSESANRFCAGAM